MKLRKYCKKVSLVYKKEINHFCAGQLIADHNEWPKPYTTIRRFLFKLGRNYWQVTNLLFALPGLYLNILETEEILANFGIKKEVNHLRWQLIADHNEWPKPYTTIRRFLIRLGRNYREVTNLLFALPILLLLKCI